MKNKRLLITGGTGSFGSTMVKSLLKKNVASITVFSRDEKKQDDLRNELSDSRVNFVIGDVRDKSSMNNIFDGIDYVFHTAALKQVPSCEFFPIEAVKTNIIGTHNVLTMAELSKVKNVVCLSTDKAAYPVNAMGISKAMLEKLVFASSQNNTGTVISCTRYGNVMCSRGSVIPKFIELAKKNKEIPVTLSEMTRFMMSLDDSVDLVLFALQNSQRGDLFVQKSPSCKIIDLAEVIIELFGSKSKVSIIGKRHGEKNSETLLTKEEFSRAIDLGNFYRVPMYDRTLYYDEKNVKIFKESNDYTSDNTKILNKEEIKNLLLSQPYVRESL